MTETIADPASMSCCHLFPGSGIQISQSLGPDPLVPPARDARGRFAKGSSGNPRGRPAGIRNPKRRVPGLGSRPLSAQALLDLLDRKPHLLRPLAAQFLPPPLAPIDPAARLGIDLPSLRMVEDFRQVLPILLEAVACGEIVPAEAVRIARRASARLRVLDGPGRLARGSRRHRAATRISRASMLTS
jgi:hypothetical protein